ncbi:MAG: AAA family ATPase, partial [Alphaproteobacteria bacterium]
APKDRMETFVRDILVRRHQAPEGAAMGELERWLRGHGLERYASLLAENAIDLDVLPDLTDADLEKLGIPLGDRKRLLKAAPSAAVATVTGEAAAEPPGVAAAEAERRQLTVMFCDLVGSTALSSRLDPEEMGHLIRAYQNAVAGEITRFEGHVAKYMGDGVLAYFGWPRAHEDEAERAVRAGLAVVSAVCGLAGPGGETLSARVGIATGRVVVGDLVGTGAAREEAVVGETPNLAARLQAFADPDVVIVSDTTCKLTGSLFQYEGLGTRRLKGLAEPIRLWRAVSERAAESRFEAARSGELSPFVGREHELGLLLDRWQQAKGGEGQAVQLSGEAGIGKSRIIQTLRERLRGEPHARLRYQCSPHYVNSAFHPVIRQLEFAAGLTVDHAPAEKLDRLEALLVKSSRSPVEVIPLFAALMSIPTGDRYPSLDLTPQEQKQQTLEAVVEQLVGVAARQPVLFIVEDAHWIDPTTRELMELITERVRDLPVLVLVTSRPEFAPSWNAYPHVTTHTLNQLGRGHCVALVEKMTAGKALPEEVLELIVAKTDGVPLFIEELTKAVLETGLLEERGDRYVLDGPLPALAIPTTLEDTLMARLDRLSAVKEIAQVGAVIGRDFSHELIAAVSDLVGDQLQDALDRVVRSGLIFRRGVAPGATYTFKHALVQDAAFRSLLKSRRRKVHGRIAQVLEERFSATAESEPEVLAHHFTEAGLAERAIPYWQSAGHRASERSANLEAIAHCERGLELVSKRPASPDRDHRELGLLITEGPACINTKGNSAPEVERVYSRARELSRKVGDSAGLFASTWGLWICTHYSGRIDSARTLSEELLSLAETQTDSALLLQAHHSAWTTLASISDLTACRDHANQGVVLYDIDKHRAHAAVYGGHDPGVCAHNHVSQTAWFLGYADQAVEAAEDAIALAQGLAHPVSLSLALVFASWLGQFRREPRSARQHAEAAIGICEEHRVMPHFAAAAGIVAGWAIAALGQPDKGIAEIRRGLEAYRATGAELRRSYFLSLLAEAYVSVGDAERGLEALAETFELVESSGERRWEAELHRIEGEIQLRRGARSDHAAESCFNTAIEVARGQGAKSLELRASTSLARLLGERGRRGDARDLLSPVYDWFTEGFDTPDLRDARALLDELA